jgi:hypothetical protein
MTRWRGGGDHVGFNAEDIEFMPNGTGRMLIRRAAIYKEAVFKRLIGRDAEENLLHEDSVANIIKWVAAWIGMSAKPVRWVSGHSIGVGATRTCWR